MNDIPSPEEIRARLQKLTPAEVRNLSELSGVPVTTLDKIRGGQTKDPGIQTVRQFMPYIKFGFSSEPASEPAGQR